MTEHAGPVLRLQGLRKAYGDQQAIDGVDLQIGAGEVFCLLGESGSGKSTLLRALAGFVGLDEGRIELDGEDITDWPAHRRPMNMMFQSYALFPHLTVAGNIRFGLQREGLAKAQISERLEQVLALLRLEHLARRKPAQLSGGQQQRVALARCLVKRPRVLLLDEPLAALDRQLRERTQFELLRLQEQLGLTFVIVTHDQEEAMTMAHRMGVMRDGRIMQIGSPRDIYDAPVSRFVAEFIGTVNLFEGTVTGQTEAGFLTVHAQGMRDDLQVSGAAETAPGATVTVAVRPERMRFLTAQDLVDESFVSNAFEARVVQRLFRGEKSAYVVAQGERRLQVSVAHGGLGSDADLPQVGDNVRVAFAPEGARVLGE